MNNKLWSGRFKETTNKLVEEFTASIPFDWKLYKYDIAGSIAHARMLAKKGITKKAEAGKIVKGLKTIEKEIDSGKFRFSIEDEDIHMAVERRLISLIGDTGKKLHTARSRNDQVSLDIRLYLRDEIKGIISLIKKFQGALILLAKKNINLIMPGYTHLQQAQPILFSHHLLAYYEMFKRDKERLEDCYKRTDVMPLGSGALAGTTFPIDRGYVARQLGFDNVTNNSLDAVSDRDFVIEFLAASSIMMMHFSRMSEELIIWSTSEFGFIELPDAFCTGSSMMPQKKNPDVAELVRGKTGRIYGNLLSLLVLMKGLPLSYNRDMQEDKEPLFDTVDTLKAALMIYTEMIKGIKISRNRIQSAMADGLILATDVADYLVKKAVPFRTAHEIVGRIVRYCLDKGRPLNKLALSEWKGFSSKFDSDILKMITIEKVVEKRDHIGGTSKKQVLKRIREIEDL
ncbi:MAG: argininosuccinate lyase [Nitrospirota bacterium]